MVDVRLLADLPDALDSAAANTFLYKTAGGMEFQTLEYSDIVGYPTTGIDSAGIISLIDASHLSTRDSSSHLNVTTYLDSGISSNIKADSAGTTLNIGNYSKPINNLYLDSSSTITIGSHSFSLANNGEVSFFGGSASSYGISSGSSSAVVVENSSYTTFLLKTDSTQTDAQVDASTNAATITENGNVKSTAFAPYHPKGYNISFNSSNNDALITATDNSFVIGTNDFTAEVWVYLTETLGTFNKVMWSGTGSSMFSLETQSTDNKLHVTDYFSVVFGTSSTALSEGVWTHVAVVRSSGTMKMYFNGTEVMSISNSTNFVGTDVRLARNDTKIILRDARLVVGTAVYTTAFTPPTEPLTAIANTKFLGANLPYLAYQDASGTGNAYATVEGNPDLVSATSPYDHVAYSPSSHGGSVYFDGSGDYVESSITATSTNDFTYECWVYFTGFGSYGSVFSSAPEAGDTGIIVSTDQWWVGNGGSVTQIVSGNKFTLNQWHHVAVVRESNTVTGYVDGVSVGSVSYTSGLTSTMCRLASRYTNNANYLMAGYISDFRLVNSAVYTANFTPPTEPLAAISGTQLLTCTNKNNIWDASGNNLTIYGDATASTTETKYSLSSVGLDGTGDYISLDKTIGHFGSADFTIEGWWYFNTVSVGYQPLMSLGESADSRGWVIITETDNELTLLMSNGSSWAYNINSTTVPSLGWQHIAAVRSGSTLTLYLNGTSIGTASIGSNSTHTTTSGALYIGHYPFFPGGARSFNGYIEGVRITKGLARYTTDFTPPNEELEA